MDARILIVEDDPSIREVTAVGPRNAGFTVETASDGQAGRDRFGAEPFDLILLEVMLPRLDGLEVCRAIRRTSTIGNPVRIIGNASVFEATFRLALLDANGAVLVDQQVMATCGTGCRGTFDVTLRYAVSQGQWGTLRAHNLSAKDGSPESVLEYPVWLTPGS